MTLTSTALIREIKFRGPGFVFAYIFFCCYLNVFVWLWCRRMQDSFCFRKKLIYTSKFYVGDHHIARLHLDL